MTKQETINYLQEELGAAEYHLWALKKGLYKVYGLNDTPAAWEQKIQALEAELESLLNPEPKPNLKEDTLDLLRKIDVVISGNTVQVIEPEPEPEPEKIPEITKDVDGIGTVTASYYENGVNEYIKFESEKGNALYCTNLQGWAVIRDELPMIQKEKIFKVFVSDLDRLGPAPQPDPPQPETPILQIVDLEELNFWQNYCEKSLKYFKDNGRLRMSWKIGDTCYRYFKRFLDNSYSLGYSERLDLLRRIAGEMYCRRQLRERLSVSSEEIQDGIKMINRFERNYERIL